MFLMVLPPRPTPPVPCLTQNTPSEASHGRLLLSPALEVIPKKLVEKIRTGKFIEMKELLQDNISLAAQLQQGSSSLQVIGAARLREVASITAWWYCFLAYVATSTSDPVTREQTDHTAGSEPRGTSLP